MNNLPYSVTEDIISKVRSLSKDRIVDMKNELQVAEPVLYKWAKDSVKEEIRELRYSGINMPSDESVKYVGGIILQAKIEGFLIGLMSHDRDWSNHFLLDDTNTEVPYSKPVSAFLAGRLDSKYYAELEKIMTEEEKKDINNWKNRALNSHREHLVKQASLNKASSFLNKNKNDDIRPVGDLEIGLTP